MQTLAGKPLLNKISWSLMTLLAIGVASYALASALLPSLRTGFVVNMMQYAATASVVHFIAGAIVIIAGALQFNSRLRSSYLHWHRQLGRVYVIGALIGGIAGLILAFESYGGLVTHFGFGLLAVFWIASTVQAYRHIRARNIVLHRQWMIRSYALCLAAVTLRLYLPLFTIAGIPFDDAYITISWLCWVPNILVAEWFFVSRLKMQVN